MKNTMFLITFGVLLYWGLNNLSMLAGALGTLVNVFSPFLLGIAIAFIFNGVMVSIENFLYHKKGLLKNVNHRIKRGISYTITLIFYSIIIFIILFMVIPELATAIVELANKIPGFVENTYAFAQDVFKNNPIIMERLNTINWEEYGDKAIDFLRGNGLTWLNDTFSIASSVVGSFLNFGLAFVFSVYLLLDKEKLIKNLKKLMYASLPEKVCKKIIHIGNMSNDAFSGFLNGKLRESLVIIVLFTIVMKIFKFPYALTISTLIGTLTLIPWFGVFVGFSIGFLLILAVDVQMAFWFLVVFIILYQLEGNLIYPIVVGHASGLSSIWIFFAGTIGAKIGGLAGLVLSIPIFSVLYALTGEIVNRRLEQKNIENIE